MILKRYCRWAIILHRNSTHSIPNIVQKFNGDPWIYFVIVFLLVNQASLLVERHRCEREFQSNSVHISRIYCSKQLDMNGKSCVS